MDIDVKDAYGNKAGCISGSDIKDAYGNKVGYINGGDIKDACGNKVGYINGGDIKDACENRVGYISGSDIKDTYGNKAGYVAGSASNIETAAAALLLLDLNVGKANTKAESKRKSSGDIWDLPSTRSESPRGFWGFLVYAFRFFALLFGWAVNFSETFDFSETASRKDWWGTCVRMIVLFLIITFVFAFIGLVETPVEAVWAILVLIPIFAVSIRRMHDIGRRGWWVLVPIAGFVMCGFFPGKTNGNPYLNQGVQKDDQA